MNKTEIQLVLTNAPKRRFLQRCALSTTEMLSSNKQGNMTCSLIAAHKNHIKDMERKASVFVFYLLQEESVQREEKCRLISSSFILPGWFICEDWDSSHLTSLGPRPSNATGGVLFDEVCKNHSLFPSVFMQAAFLESDASSRLWRALAQMNRGLTFVQTPAPSVWRFHRLFSWTWRGGTTAEVTADMSG